MTKSWNGSLDEGNKVAVILIHLSKVFNRLDHDIILAHVYSYGFGINSLTFIRGYLISHKKKVKPKL